MDTQAIPAFNQDKFAYQNNQEGYPAPLQQAPPQPQFRPVPQQAPPPVRRASQPQVVLPVPREVGIDAQVQIRNAALKASRDYLMDRSYDDNQTRLAAEIDLARFFLGE